MNLLRTGAPLAVLLLLLAVSNSVGVEAAGQAIVTSSFQTRQDPKHLLEGPETVVFDNLGFIYTGVGDGTIRRVNPFDYSQTIYAYVVKLADRTYCGQPGNNTAEAICGRPLGLRFDRHYNLYVCDAYYGLLFVPRANPANVIVLSNSSDGIPFGFTNALAINLAQTVIYFTDTSPTQPRYNFTEIFFQAKPEGRLLRYDISTGKTTTILSGLVFANGVAFNKFETEILILETSLKRVRRYYLVGPKAGQNDFFNTDVGGYPDNVDFDILTGYFLLGCNSVASPLLDAIIPCNNLTLIEYYKTVLANTPGNGFISVLDTKGALVRVITDATGKYFARASEAKRYGPYIYVGSVQEPYLARISACLLTTPIVQGNGTCC